MICLLLPFNGNEFDGAELLFGLNTLFQHFPWIAWMIHPNNFVYIVQFNNSIGRVCVCGGSNNTSTNAIRQLMDHISLSSIKPSISISISRFVKPNDARSFSTWNHSREWCCLFPCFHFYFNFNCFICVIHRSIFNFNLKSTLSN